MAFDPFPNTGSAELEQRLKVVFESLGTALVVPTDPLQKKDGLIWLNTTQKKLKLHSKGITWTIGIASVES